MANTNTSSLSIQLKNTVMCFATFVVMVSCGGIHSSQHPDSQFENGDGIYSTSQFENYMNSTDQDPRFRKAQVTTQTSPLKLKVKPDSGASGPSSGPTELAKGSRVDVFWPTDVINNHIKVYVDGRTLWVTHKSSGGQEYVTLLEDIYLPQTQIPSSGIISSPGGINPLGPTAPSSPASSEDGFVPSSLKRISLSSSTLNLARQAIAVVKLRAATVAACSFNPAIGNNSSKNNCYKKIVVSENFRNFVGLHGQQCAVSAAREAFGKSPQKVLFHSSGGGQVRANRRVGGGPKKSTHATGQALDLFGVSLYFAGKNPRKVLMHRDHTNGSSVTEKQNHKFYWAFTKCWRGRVQSKAPCVCSGSKTGALTYTDNSAHYNHLHMSLPMCERRRYNVSCI